MTGVREEVTGREDELPARAHSRKRLVYTVAIPVVFALVFGGGWFAATRFESPAQREAAAKPPVPSSVTALVERSDLAKIVTSTVSLAPALQQSIPLAGQEGAVVSGTPKAAGVALSAGDQVLEVNARPLIALPGAFPFFRDVTAASVGSDVRQLQQGLRAAGYRVPVDGTCGQATQNALRSLYTHLGYALPSSSSSAASPTGGSAAASSAEQGSVGSIADSAAVPAPFVIPKTELFAVPSLPATLVSLPPVGTRISSDTQIATESGTLQASSAISPNVAATMKPGISVRLTGPDGKDIEGTLAQVIPAAKAGDDSRILYATPDLPAAWRGTAVVATITVRLAARDSLIVPSTAIVSQGSSHPYVMKRVSATEFVRVAVHEEASLDGRSAITLRGGTQLSSGDRIRVR